MSVNRQPTSTTGNSVRQFTAREYLMTFEPETLDALENIENSLIADTIQAHYYARRLELPSDGHKYSAAIWALVYPI